MTEGKSGIEIDIERAEARLDREFRGPTLKDLNDYVEMIGCPQKINHIKLMRQRQAVLSCKEAHPDDCKPRMILCTRLGWLQDVTFEYKNFKVPPTKIRMQIPGMGEFTFWREGFYPREDD